MEGPQATSDPSANSSAALIAAHHTQGSCYQTEKSVGAQWKHRIRQASANAKGRAFTKLTKELILAAKAGADPATNARLRAAIEVAKKASMPRETLERAVKKGAGLLEAET